MKNKKNSRNIGLGVGYVSVMLIFAVVCLTIFAVLSFKTSLSDSTVNKRSGDFLRQYYSTDTIAKDTLSKLNDIAYQAKTADFFEEEFENTAKNIENVTVKRVKDGLSTNYTVPINELQELKVSVLFDRNGNYKIEQWQCITISDDTSDSHLNVWDGSF